MELEMVKITDMCPEQYEARWFGHTVGYVRVRGDKITVTCPNVGGEVVYSSIINGDDMLDEYEREYQLACAKKCVEAWVRKDGERQKARKRAFDALDHASDVIWEAVFKYGVNDQKLQDFCEQIDAFVREYEDAN